MICRSWVHQPAPSILAASYSSVGHGLQAGDVDDHEVADGPQAHQRQRRIDPDLAAEPVRPRDADGLEGLVQPARLGVQEADPDQGAGHERDHHRHVDEGPERALARQLRVVHEQGEAQARQHRDGDHDQRELEGRDERLRDERVRGHPDVVVQPDEPRLVRVEQVEVRQRHDEGRDDRAGREQGQADQPRADEDVSPERLTSRGPEQSVASGPSGASRAAPGSFRSWRGPAPVAGRGEARRSASRAGRSPPGTPWRGLRVGRVVVVEDALEGRLQRRELGVDVEPFSGPVLVVDGLEGLAGLLVVGHPAPGGWACRRSRASPA